MRYSKTRVVKDLNRGTTRSAGIDFYVPLFDKTFKEDFFKKNLDIQIIDNKIYLKSNQRCLIPSGIKVDIPKGFMLNAFNKSGISTKKGLIKGAETIDEDYQGEIHLSLINTSNETIEISENEKIIQFILIPVSYLTPDKVPIEKLYFEKTNRAESGFGSTGN